MLRCPSNLWSRPYPKSLILLLIGIPSHSSTIFQIKLHLPHQSITSSASLLLQDSGSVPTYLREVVERKCSDFDFISKILFVVGKWFTILASCARSCCFSRSWSGCIGLTYCFAILRRDSLLWKKVLQKSHSESWGTELIGENEKQYVSQQMRSSASVYLGLY